MLDYDNGFQTMTIYCDNCDRWEDFSGDWQECINDAKANGWVIRKEDDWMHFCDRECQKEYLTTKALEGGK